MKNCFNPTKNSYFMCLIIIGAFNFVQLKVNSEETISLPTEKEIKEGNCENASFGDMVFQDHIHKPALPLLVRNATASWHGDYKIYCVIVVPQSEHATEAEVLISEGGVNHTFVTVEIHSKRNQGLDYNIQVFGKKLQN